jgi:RNA polymerase sigma-70 factor (ECF subfamily)
MNLNSYQENAQFSTWVFRIATNACLDHIRRIKRERARILDPSSVEVSHTELWMNSNNPEEIVAHREFIHHIYEAIDNLPAKYRAVLLLNIQQGFSYQEIAEVMHIPVQTVGTQLHRAKSLLRRKLAPILKGGEADGLQTALPERSSRA